jgi:hypothetical protein
VHRTDDWEVTKSEGPTDDAVYRTLHNFPDLTPRSSVFLEKLIRIRSSALQEVFPHCMKPEDSFITVFTRARHWYLS